MRIDKTPDELKAGSIVPSGESKVEPKIEHPVSSDLHMESGRQTGLNQIKNNAAGLRKQKLPQVLDACCNAAIKEGSLYITGGKIPGKTADITEVMGHVFKNTPKKTE